MFRSNFQVLLYLIKIVHRKYNPHCFIVYMIMKYCTVLKQKHIFMLQAVSPGFLLDLLKENEIDINNTIIINKKGIEGSLKVVETRTLSGSKIKRNVFMAANKDLHPEGIGLISHNLQCNLKGAEKCRFKNCKDDIVKFADEVELSLISVPNDCSHLMIDSCLKNYFEAPKLLYKDDIIEVNLKKCGKDIFFALKKNINIYDNLYFKCNKLIYNGLEASSEGLFCVSDKSTLKQIANVQGFIPKKLHTNYMCESPLPEALNDYFKSIKKAMYFFINKSEKSSFSPVFLLEGRKGSGKHLLVQSVAYYFGMHLCSINNFDISANVYAQNETKLRNILFSAKMAAPCILEINNFENFGKNNEGQYDERLINTFIVELKSFFQNGPFPTFIFCNNNEKKIPLELKRLFLKIYEITSPNERERENMLQWILEQNKISADIRLNSIASKTHGFLLEDLRTLVHYALVSFYKYNPDAAHKNIPEEYFLKAVDVMQSSHNESLGAPKVPKVKWTDVGGLSEVKEEIIKTIKLPLKYPQLLKKTGLKRSGILLFGPPGTGKTLLAKAVATECGLCFLSVKGPELLNMYVGQSEQNVREVFERGREASPCIIFFDELDSLAPNRGVAGDSGGVMDRVVSQLLAEMDGLNRNGDVFVIGATNRPDLIDPALLRPGRFDKLLYVGPCTDKESKTAVLTALTKCFRFSEKSVIDQVVDLCPENISGADFYGLCSNAWMSAVRRLITIMGNESEKNADYATLDDVIVTLDDFQTAIKSIKPSIKQEDMEYFNKLKSEFT